jgi:SNF2 family DNA or RNA helicase
MRARHELAFQKVDAISVQRSFMQRTLDKMDQAARKPDMLEELKAAGAGSLEERKRRLAELDRVEDDGMSLENEPEAGEETDASPLLPLDLGKDWGELIGIAKLRRMLAGPFRGAILEDEMGLGKTLTCIITAFDTFDAAPCDEDPVFKGLNLVIAPKALVDNFCFLERQM